MHKTFATPQPVELYVEIGRGSVTATAGDVTESSVEITGDRAEETLAELNGQQLSVVSPKHRTGFFSGEPHLDVVIVVPATSGFIARTGSAAIIGHGGWGNTKLKSGSGDIRLEQLTASSVVETGSGDIAVERADGALRVKSGSGDVRVRRCGAETSMSTGSGDIEIDHAGGPLVVKTGSGDLRVAAADGDVAMATGSGDTLIEQIRPGVLTLKGASGDIRIGIPAGMPVWTDISTVSGRVHSNLEGVGAPEEGQPFIELRAKTVSGDVTLQQLSH